MLTQDRFEAAVERVDLLCQVPVGLPVARAPAHLVVVMPSITITHSSIDLQAIERLREQIS